MLKLETFSKKDGKIIIYESGRINVSKSVNNANLTPNIYYKFFTKTKSDLIRFYVVTLILPLTEILIIFDNPRPIPFSARHIYCPSW